MWWSTVPSQEKLSFDELYFEAEHLVIRLDVTSEKYKGIGAVKGKSVEQVAELQGKVGITICDYTYIFDRNSDNLCGVCGVGSAIAAMVLCSRCDTWYHVGPDSCDNSRHSHKL